MQKVPFTNTGTSFRFVGGQMVAPGETIYVSQYDHPGYKAPAPEAVKEDTTDPVLDRLDQKVDDIVAQLPELSDDDFERLRQAEQDGKTRSTLMKAFEAEALRRAEERVTGDKDGEPGE